MAPKSPSNWDSHSGYGNNARLYFQPETGGSYYFAAAPGGTGDAGNVPQSGTYRLSMADVTDTEIPASTATAASVAVGGTATGRSRRRAIRTGSGSSSKPTRPT